MATRKLARQEINDKLNIAGDRLAAKNSHAYAHGVFHTSLVNAMTDLPLHKQLEILQVITALANKED